MLLCNKLLHIDVETYSDTNLTMCGAYRYIDSKSFKILLLAYAYDDEPVKVVDLAQGEQLPPKLIRDIKGSDYIKVAHNAAFERLCLSKHLNTYLDPATWECTLVRAATIGLPLSLEKAAEALGLEEQKMAEGKSLIEIFCKPSSNGERVLPENEPEKWELFKAYNIQDVETERSIYKTLSMYPRANQNEKKLYAVDQIINDKGVLIDQNLINKITDYHDSYSNRLIAEAKEISGIDNPKSNVQTKAYLKSKRINTPTVDKSALMKILDIPFIEDDIKKFLKMKLELSKTSTAKYKAMTRSVCSDGRVHGMLQFYGAATGRWAGRIVQLQNLPKNKMKDLDLARNVVASGDFELLEMLYESPMDVLSQLIRTAFIAPDGYTFVIADYSAIEARVIAWLAGENWRLDVFKTHGKIYEASASQMFHVPIEKITKDSPLRAKGKVAELALGYQGSVGALKAMGAEDMGLTEEEMKDIVKKWRQASPNIVNYWYDVERAAIDAISNPGKVYKLARGVAFKMIGKSLFLRLPSGRFLCYYDAKLEKNKKYRGYEITYMGIKSENSKWSRISTYSGKLVENITQAVARDCLAAAMIALHDAGFTPSFHVHDEVIIEVRDADKDESLKKITKIMELKDLEWKKDLPLTADAYTSRYYKKD